MKCLGEFKPPVYISYISLQYSGSKTANINIKQLQSTFKRSCYRPCSHRSKTAKIKRERERGRERDGGNSSSYEAYNTIAC
jgi:hypothetical protein